MNTQNPAENKNSGTPWKKRGLFALNILAWLLTIAVAVFFFVHIQIDREEKERIRKEPLLQVCMGQLARIGVALKQYAEKHGGKFPESLDDLVEEKLLPDKEMLKCPEKGSDYLYLYDQSLKMPCSASFPLVIDKLNNHSNRVNVLYADFQVRNEPVLKRRYTRLAVRKSSCTKNEQKYLKKRLREFNRIFFVKDE